MELTRNCAPPIVGFGPQEGVPQNSGKVRLLGRSTKSKALAGLQHGAGILCNVTTRGSGFLKCRKLGSQLAVGRIAHGFDHPLERHTELNSARSLRGSHRRNDVFAGCRCELVTVIHRWTCSCGSAPGKHQRACGHQCQQDPVHVQSLLIAETIWRAPDHRFAAWPNLPDGRRACSPRAHRMCRYALPFGGRPPSFWRDVRRPSGCARSRARVRSAAPTAPAAESVSLCFAVGAGGLRACSGCCARHFGVMHHLDIATPQWGTSLRPVATAEST